MYKQFILPALLLVFTSIAALAQDAPLTRTPSTPAKKPQATEKAKTQTGTAGQARTEESLPKGAKVKQKTGNQKKTKGKAKGHDKNKAKGNANGHHKGEGTEGEGHQHQQEGENGKVEKRQDNDGVETRKPKTPATKKPGTSTTKKPKTSQPKTTQPESTTPDAKQRTGGQAPANSGGK